MKQEAPISLGGSSSLEQRKEVYKMRKTISNKTTKERIFDAIEYSCAVKPHVRSDGNRQSGTRKPLSASLLA